MSSLLARSVAKWSLYQTPGTGIPGGLRGTSGTILDLGHNSSISNHVLICYSVAVLKRRTAEKCAAVLFIIQDLAGVAWLSIFTFVMYL